MIKTKRLIIRKWTMDDLYDLHEILIDDDIAKGCGYKPSITIDESRRVLDHHINDDGYLAIENGSKVIGNISMGVLQFEIKPEDQGLKAIEIGYELNRSYWNNGYMTETVKAAIDQLFNNEHYDLIFAGHFIDNIASKRVLEKCGFKDYLDQEYLTARGTIEKEKIMVIRKSDR